MRDLARDRALVSAVAMAVTIIGLPLALANLKLIPVSLVPLGKEIVPVDRPAPWVGLRPRGAEIRAAAAKSVTRD